MMRIEIWRFQVFLPTGLIMEALVYPDDEIYYIKQIVMNKATTDGNMGGTGLLFKISPI